jgi:hypothetical protein
MMGIYKEPSRGIYWHYIRTKFHQQAINSKQVVDTGGRLHTICPQASKLKSKSLCTWRPVSRSVCVEPISENHYQILSLKSGCYNLSRHVAFYLTRGRVCLPCVLVFAKYIHTYLRIIVYK